MNKKRRKFSTKFKAKVALEAAKEIKTVKELSTRFELSGSQIVKWKSQLLAGLPLLFESTGNKEKKKEDEAKHIAVLYEQIGRLKMERDYLEKKMEQYG